MQQRPGGDKHGNKIIRLQFEEDIKHLEESVIKPVDLTLRFEEEADKMALRISSIETK